MRLLAVRSPEQIEADRKKKQDALIEKNNAARKIARAKTRHSNTEGSRPDGAKIMFQQQFYKLDRWGKYMVWRGGEWVRSSVDLLEIGKGMRL